ncbi:MAG: hypothetical protein IKF78_12120 [Atopobiaceae bacterium]|nr:hypothetical protein [Atopobiaceae bacterium]
MVRRDSTDALGRAMYELICSRDGVSARDIARTLGVTRKEVNQRLYTYPFIRDLCFRDEDYLWYGTIGQGTPHVGLREYCGWYATVREFMACDEDGWLDELKEGCVRIGRSLNDTRGLIHSFLDCRSTMRELFDTLRSFGVDCGGWEIAFEMRIKRAKWIRIYADVLVITPTHAFTLEFKMKDAIDSEEVAQAAKYVPYLEVVLGSRVNVVAALVLTRARELFCHEPLGRTDAEVTVASRDMLFNVFDEYLGFLA